MTDEPARYNTTPRRTTMSRPTTNCPTPLRTNRITLGTQHYALDTSETLFPNLRHRPVIRPDPSAPFPGPLYPATGHLALQAIPPLPPTPPLAQPASPARLGNSSDAPQVVQPNNLRLPEHHDTLYPHLSGAPSRHRKGAPPRSPASLAGPPSEPGKGRSAAGHMKQGVERFSLPCPPGRGSAQPPQFAT